MPVTTIEPGRYICVRTSGFAPAVIRWATRSRVDHAAIMLPPGDRVAEAEPGGVIISPLSKYAGCYVTANLAEPLTGRQLARVAAEAESIARQRVQYNWAAIGEDAATWLHWHSRLLLRLAADDHDLDCSQMVAVCGQAAGADWLCGRAAVCEVTPGDLDRRSGMTEVQIT